MSDVRWSGTTRGVPIAADFQGTYGAGTPMITDLNTMGVWILAGNLILPLLGDFDGGLSAPPTVFSDYDGGDAAGPLFPMADLDGGSA